jgi:hypothetical protein
MFIEVVLKKGVFIICFIFDALINNKLLSLNKEGIFIPNPEIRHFIDSSVIVIQIRVLRFFYHKSTNHTHGYLFIYKWRQKCKFRLSVVFDKKVSVVIFFMYIVFFFLHIV